MIQTIFNILGFSCNNLYLSIGIIIAILLGCLSTLILLSDIIVQIFCKLKTFINEEEVNYYNWITRKYHKQFIVIDPITYLALIIWASFVIIFLWLPALIVSVIIGIAYLLRAIIRYYKNKK